MSDLPYEAPGFWTALNVARNGMSDEEFKDRNLPWLRYISVLGACTEFGVGDDLQQVKDAYAQAVYHGCFLLWMRLKVGEGDPLFNSSEWNTPGPEASVQDFVAAKEHLRGSDHRLAGLVHSYLSSKGKPNENSSMIALTSFTIGTLYKPGADSCDLHTLMRFFRWSPRELFELEAEKRKSKMQKNERRR